MVLVCPHVEYASFMLDPYQKDLMHKDDTSVKVNISHLWDQLQKEGFKGSQLDAVCP